MSPAYDISAKANRVVNIILLCFLLILVRVWYLAVIQHDSQLQQAYKPQRKTVIDRVERAPIYDRFGIPLALNKMQYDAAVCYAHIREIPSVAWKKGPSGKPVRVYARMEYITALAKIIAEELGLNPVDIEDTIHGKASLFPHTPFVLKEDISEEQYFRLRMLEKDYLGIQTMRSARRFYPQGKLACDVIGYLGAISPTKYAALAKEMRELEEYVAARERGESPFLPIGFDSPIAVRDRLREIQEKSYTINDLVGKAGVEASYEEDLRGFHGKKIFEVDTKGNSLRELAGSRSAISGRKLYLSLSAELQAYAEALLSAHVWGKGSPVKLDENFMKGCAVVAMIPKTGEVVALASYPRFDPNDFIPARDTAVKQEKEKSVKKWLESETYIGEIWDGKRDIEREYFSFSTGKYHQESVPLTWERFLETILPAEGAIAEALKKIDDLQTAVRIQEIGAHHPFLRGISLEADRLLALDLCHLAAPRENLPPALLKTLGAQSLKDYHLLRQAAMRLQAKMRRDVQELFHDFDFSAWRQAHFKEYLKRKRKEEKEQKKYARPYTDYLDGAEKTLFQAFWEAYRLVLLHTAATGRIEVSLERYPHLQPYVAHILEQRALWLRQDPLLNTLAQIARCPEGISYLQSMRQFEELNAPLLGRYPRLRHKEGKQLEKHLAAAFYPLTGYGFGRSQAFRQATAQGSVFKLVTAYQALMERYQKGVFADLNPMTIIDNLKGDKSKNYPTQVLGQTLDGRPILRLYKGGMLPRSSYSNMGKIDLIGALEQSSNVYFAMLAGDFLSDPAHLPQAAKIFGYGSKTGIDLPGEIAGNVPDDVQHNRSGLYSLAIGQHSLAVTPLQTAVMVSAMVTKGKIVKPHVVSLRAGSSLLRDDASLFSAPEYPFQESLASVGIHFPLFTQALSERSQQTSQKTAVEIVRSLAFPREIERMIFEGMQRVVSGQRGSARPQIMRNLFEHPTAVRDYHELHRDMIAKTGTAQLRYKQTIDKETESEMRRHVWLATVSYPKEKQFSPDRYEHPELVVVVFLHFQGGGRDAGPIAGQIIKKWRELNARK